MPSRYGLLQAFTLASYFTYGLRAKRNTKLVKSLDEGHKQSGIHMIFQIQIISPLAKVVGNVSAAVQALCTPHNSVTVVWMAIAEGDGEDG